MAFSTKEELNIKKLMSFSQAVKEEAAKKQFTLKNRHGKIKSGGQEEERQTLVEAFLRCGTITDPERFYHLEFLPADGQEEEAVLTALGSFGIPSGRSRRRGRPVIYIKDSEAISDLPKIFGAHKALLEFENIRVLKGVRETVQRKVNCETANIRKTADASVRQAEDIEFIRRELGLMQLPEGLRSIAELRLERPQATLGELAESMDPPLTRSGVNHRLRKLSEIAEDLRRRQEAGEGPES